MADQQQSRQQGDQALLSHSETVGGLKFSFYVHKVGQTKLQELPERSKLLGNVVEVIENYCEVLKKRELAPGTVVPAQAQP